VVAVLLKFLRAGGAISSARRRGAARRVDYLAAQVKVDPALFAT
jgi:hypothetical protein